MKSECVSGAGVLVATPCCSPDGSEALPPQQRSQQPASTAGEDMEGGGRITALIVPRDDPDCANRRETADQYVLFADLIEQHTNKQLR